MFSQKKRNHRWIYAVLIIIAITLAGLAVVTLAGNSGGKGSNHNSAQRVNLPKETDAPYDYQNDKNNLDSENPSQKTEEPKQFYQSYYLVKYDKNVIKIFFSDETGNLTELENTSIVYETLSDGDQSAFKDGIRLNSRDDLNKLIMDYES